MLIVQMILLVLVLLVCSSMPGYAVVRRFRWSALEKLCGAIGLSLIFLYLASFAIYLSTAGAWVVWFVVGASIVVALINAKDLRAMLAARPVRAALGVFAFLFVWTFSLFLLVRTYSGASWGGDWLEHLQRTLFFVHRFPLSTKFIGLYLLPARPPMMNLIAALFLRLFGDSFEVFSVVFVFLNLLVVLACVLMFGAFRPRGRRGAVPLAFFLACSPILIQGATYTWTKSLCSFFVILGLWFYLAAQRKSDTGRRVFAFVLLIAGTLVHYSAAPYALFLGVHYLVAAVRDRRWREMTTIAAISIPFAGTWFWWSAASYGLRATLASNTSVTSAQKWTASGRSAFHRIVLNIFDTVVPHLPSDSPFFTYLRPAAWVRESFFPLYQGNVIFAIGIIGGIVAVLLFVRQSVSSGIPIRERIFWAEFVVFTFVIAVAVVGERAPGGAANVTLEPLVLLGVIFLASRADGLPQVVRGVVLAGCIFDCGVGVLLHHALENAENDACGEDFHVTLVMPALPSGRVAVATRTGLGPAAVSNWQAKRFGFVARAVGEAVATGRIAIAPQRVRELKTQVGKLDTDDRQSWGGWWGRHGGRVVFPGDHLGCARNALLTWLVLMFLPLLILATRQTFHRRLRRRE